MGISKNYEGQGSLNKPISCGASGAYTPGPDDEEEASVTFYAVFLCQEHESKKWYFH
jgi:hypothetical protein